MLYAADLAAWRDNKNIGEKNTCRNVLQDAGFDAEHLLQAAEQDPVKKQLFTNTSRSHTCNTGLVIKACIQ